MTTINRGFAWVYSFPSMPIFLRPKFPNPAFFAGFEFTFPRPILKNFKFACPPSLISFTISSTFVAHRSKMRLFFVFFGFNLKIPFPIKYCNEFWQAAP